MCEICIEDELGNTEADREYLEEKAHDRSIIQQIEMILFAYRGHETGKTTLETAEEIFNLCKK